MIAFRLDVDAPVVFHDEVFGFWDDGVSFGGEAGFLVVDTGRPARLVWVMVQDTIEYHTTPTGSA
ncbi:MAG: hypothetical protein CMJ49_13985 [Planctomycetaceae bacterium]|nr:hypothetical protein [Planctomycetaceae bacterium]